MKRFLMLLTLLMSSYAAPITRFLIAPKGNGTESFVRGVLSEHGVAVKDAFKPIGSNGFSLVSLDGGNVADVKAILSSVGVYAEEDFLVRNFSIPNDPYYNGLWAMPRISAGSAWQTFTGKGTIKVCVIDTGIDHGHADLAGNVVSIGYNAVANSQSAMDDNGHGTHCAGTIGAVGNNGVGVAGVAWNVSLIGCKFLTSGGSGYTSDAIECISYCRSQGAKITSNSWGGGDYSQALYNEILTELNMGNLFIAAAGNENRDVDRRPSYPASYDLPNIISVGSTTETDAKSPFSNFGSAGVDLMAPGSNIISTYPGSSYVSLSGTSMAAPHVTGAAALIWQYAPQLTATQIKSLLITTVDPIPDLRSYCLSGGRLNVSRALERATLSTMPSPRCCKYTRQGICKTFCR